MCVDPTCLTTGLDDAYDGSPQRILRHAEVVHGLLEHRRRHQPGNHADVDSGIDEGDQTTTVLSRHHHGNYRIGLPVDRAREGDHSCKNKGAGRLYSTSHNSKTLE